MRSPRSLVPALLLVCAFLIAAAPPQAPCASAEFKQLDFWVGEWDLTWPASGTNPAGRGTNRIAKVLDGCVVEENFAAEGQGALVGRSLSTWDGTKKAWRQTWVDNQGSYLDFEGTLAPDSRSLSRATNRNGKPGIARMSWVNVAADSLDWRWEASADGGATWKLLWAIHYVRKAGTKAAEVRARPGPCAARPESGQFDFWVGSWDVRISPGRENAGELVGTSHEEKRNGGCLLTESYAQTDGFTGQSANFWDPTLKRWRQTWVDSNGGVGEFSGAFTDGAMRFEGETHTASGGRILRRMTLTPLGSDSVRQYSEASRDGGATWTFHYDFTYSRIN